MTSILNDSHSLPGMMYCPSSAPVPHGLPTKTMPKRFAGLMSHAYHMPGCDLALGGRSSQGTGRRDFHLSTMVHDPNRSSHDPNKLDMRRPVLPQTSR